MVPRSALAIARELEREILDNVAREVGPDGKPWPKKVDGGRALQGAASGLSVRADGTTIVAELDGVHARHHHGRVRGGIARPILPTRISERFANAIRRILSGEFRRAMEAR